jgi:phosphocarrier protein
MGLMMLGAAKGDRITISAEGEGAEEAVAALAALVEDKFGEE